MKKNINVTLYKFTMIELLVVLSTIMLLALVLFPALNNMKKTARSRQCSNNLKQLSVGFSYYNADNSGYYPHNSWTIVLTDNYIDDSYFYKCEEAPEKNSAGRTLHASYSYTGVFYPSTDYFAVFRNKDYRIKNANIKSPESKIILTEYWHSTAYYGRLDDSGNFLNDCRSRSLHKYSSNYLFVDGHVELIEMPVNASFEEVKWAPYSLSFHPKR